MAPIALAHVYSLALFPEQSPMINKIVSTILQIVGGLIVLHSVDANLGLFRKRKLVDSVFSWIRECPVISRSIFVSASCASASAVSGTASIRSSRAPQTLEERLADVERHLEELRTDISVQHREIRTRIENVKSELSQSIAANQTNLNKLSEQLEKATIGGFKQQAFGVLLVIYGAGVNVIY